jgi:hypothetical protein
MRGKSFRTENGLAPIAFAIPSGAVKKLATKK